MPGQVKTVDIDEMIATLPRDEQDHQPRFQFQETIVIFMIDAHIYS